MLPLVLIATVGIAAFGGGSALRFVALRRQLAPVEQVPIDDAAGGWAPPQPGEVRARRPNWFAGWLAGRLTRRPSSNALVFVVCAFGYAVVGAYLLQHGSMVGDAESRVADAWYVLFSRDPHVGAIGFVWNPLPSVLAMPFLLLKGLVPFMARRAYAGVLVSSLCMAGSVVQLRNAVRELGAAGLLAAALVVGYGLNPMVVYYGANGMSEATYLLCLAVAIRYLARWVATRSLSDLVWAGVGLGVCYLARYEAALAAIGAAGVVLAVHLVDRVLPPAERRREVVADLIVLLLPFAVAFVGWAVTSQVITGDAFEQFHSEYGNASQVRLVGSANLPGHGTGWPLPVFVLLQMLAFAPLLPIVVAASLLHGWRRRDLRALAPMLVLGAIALFTGVSFCLGETFGWLRFQLPIALMTPFCLAVLFARPRAPLTDSTVGVDPGVTEHPAVPRPRPQRRHGLGRGVGTVAFASILALAAVPTSGWAMLDRRLGVGERPQLDFVIHPHDLTASELATKSIPASAADLAHRFDVMHLAPGSVVTDTFTPCVSLMLMNSDNPHQFVITSDRDFQPTLADPVLFGAHYLLVPLDSGYGTLDAVNRAYPSLYDKGAPFARLVATYNEPGCPSLRLYRVVRTTEGS